MYWTALKKLGPFFLLISAGFLLYRPVWQYDFTYLDDYRLIVENQQLISTAKNIPSIFKKDVFAKNTAYYRPLLTLSLMVDALSSGKDPAGYHRTNLILHLLAACLIYLLFLKLSYSGPVALFSGLLYIVHPLFTANVAWIPGRNDILLTGFTVGAFLFFIFFQETGKRRHFWLHLAMFMAAVLTKEIALLLPLLCILYMRLWPAQALSWRHKVLLAAAWLTAAAAFVVLRQGAIADPWTAQLLYLKRSFQVYSPALISYIGKALFPVNLAVLPVIKDLPLWYGICSLAVLLAGVGLTKNIRLPQVIFGLAWLVIFLVPAVLLHNPDFMWGEDMLLESRMYLPAIGLFMLIAETGMVRSLTYRKYGLLLLLAAVLGALSYRTVAYREDFRNKMAFWQSAVAGSPHSAVAHHNLGGIYYIEGNREAAAREFTAALQLNPRKPNVHASLALVYMDAGKYADAEKEFRKELLITPLSAETYFNIGLLCYQQGKNKDAAAAWEKALDIDKELTEVYGYLAMLYFADGNNAQAAYYISQARRRGVYIQPKILKLLKIQ